MKAPEFDYVRARSLEEVFALLDEYGDEARILAGGQTLLATMNMRLSEPQILVDIAGLSALKQVSVVGDVLRIGAMVTHAEIEDSPVVREHAPLLSEVAPFVAHRAIRNLGTFGGSIAFADPAAEWPCILVAVRGVVIAQGVNVESRRTSSLSISTRLRYARAKSSSRWISLSRGQNPFTRSTN
jgi:carbon-monoxide dehydrogenase medium subunit